MAERRRRASAAGPSERGRRHENSRLSQEHQGPVRGRPRGAGGIPRQRETDRRAAGASYNAWHPGGALSDGDALPYLRLRPPKATVSEAELRVEAKRLKLEQLKVRQRRLENRIRYLASRQARRDETRRKILIGAVILAKIERGEFDEKKLRAMLDSALTRKDDRQLFGL